MEDYREGTPEGDESRKVSSHIINVVETRLSIRTKSIR